VSEPPITRLFEDRVQVIPDEEEAAVSLTVAVKAGKRVREIVEVPVADPTILIMIGVALNPKSGKFAWLQMLLSTIPRARSKVVVTPVVTMVIVTLASMRNPEDWSNAKPEVSENAVPMEEGSVTEELRKLTVLVVPRIISLLVELKVGAIGVPQMGSGA
jgi:hypothetical protein